MEYQFQQKNQTHWPHFQVLLLNSESCENQEQARRCDRGQKLYRRTLAKRNTGENHSFQQLIHKNVTRQKIGKTLRVDLSVVHQGTADFLSGLHARFAVASLLIPAAMEGV